MKNSINSAACVNKISKINGLLPVEEFSNSTRLSSSLFYVALNSRTNKPTYFPRKITWNVSMFSSSEPNRISF